MKYTPFYDRHLQSGAKMVEFTGYSMPIQFKGIILEHHAVRQKCGLFDVSHMGELLLTGKNAFDTIQNLITNDISSLQNNKARYTLMANMRGGVVDDIIVYKFHDERYMLVVNAANTQKDAEWVKRHLIGDARFENISEITALIALQGALAESVMKEIFDMKDLPQKYFSFTTPRFSGEEVIISRTGYTGEDGFEIYCSNNLGLRIYDELIEKGKDFGLELCGLGARDTLRMEAGMPLYGHEMDDSTLASEINLDFAIKTDKPYFIGKEALTNIRPKYKRIGLKLIDLGIARQNAKVYDEENEVGIVTSGTHSPTLGYPIAMARVNIDTDANELYVEVRNKKLKAEVVPLPFYKRK